MEKEINELLEKIGLYEILEVNSIEKIGNRTVIELNLKKQ